MFCKYNRYNPRIDKARYKYLELLTKKNSIMKIFIESELKKRCMQV